jgi:radical SAM superfamily enzyme YgiQ (UPF0313 family)
MRVLLVSTYELGHQPVHVASPAAALMAAGHDVRAVDLSVERWDREQLEWAERVAFSVPMHTAMRLAVQAAAVVRRERPTVPICFYGLYAPVGRDRVVGALADRAIAGEYEPQLMAWASDANEGVTVDLARAGALVPARALLPGLDRYAHLAYGGGERLVGAVEASHGCSHRCRHCPIPVVYGGRVRTVAEDVVVADVAQLVAMGAEHITFADPDFLNAVHHAERVVDAVHGAFPALTFDITTKVEHILRYESIWPAMARRGCLFVVSAVECLNDTILDLLDKGHHAADASRAVALLRESGIEMRPSFLPFTPWSTADDVFAICEFVARHDLVGNVDPIQYTIRLLLPDGSLLLDQAALAPHLGPYDPDLLTWTWTAADPRTEALQAELLAIVEAGQAAEDPAPAIFDRVWSATAAAAGLAPPDTVPLLAGSVEGRPRLTEPWFC